MPRKMLSSVMHFYFPVKCTHTYIRTYLRMYVFTITRIFVCTCIHITYVRTYVCVCSHTTYIRTYVFYSHTTYCTYYTHTLHTVHIILVCVCSHTTYIRTYVFYSHTTYCTYYTHTLHTYIRMYMRTYNVQKINLFMRLHFLIRTTTCITKTLTIVQYLAYTSFPCAYLLVQGAEIVRISMQSICIDCYTLFL